MTFTYYVKNDGLLAKLYMVADIAYFAPYLENNRKWIIVL